MNMRNRSKPDRLAAAANQNIKEKNYWKNKLSGDMVKSHFPYDNNKLDPGQLTYKPGALQFEFSPELFAKLTGLGNGSDFTHHLILAAGLVGLLHRYTGNKDIIISTPIYKQEIEGDFINTVLVLRSQWENRISFKELLIHLGQVITEAVENQSYPLEVLMADLGLPAPGNDSPLSGAAILLENIHDRCYIEHIRPGVLFSFLRTDGSLKGILEYNSALYEKNTIKRIITHFKNFLHHALNHLHKKISAVDLLSTEERHQLLEEFNSTETTYIQDKLLQTWFEEQVEKTPGSIALVHGEAQLTYEELNKRANRLAHYLRSRGLKPDGIAGLMLDRSFEMIVGIIGILKAGGAYFPIDSENPPDRVMTMLKDSQASILLTGSGVLKKQSLTGLLGLQSLKVEPRQTLPRPPCDFESLPIPDRSLIDYDRYNQYIGHAMVKNAVGIQPTRGCPYHCAFCHRIWPRKHTFRSAENIFSEVQLYYQMGVRRFVIIDDIFNYNQKNSSVFFKLIIKNRLKVQLFFPNGLRGDILTKEYMDLMIEAGTVNLDLALETASPRLQKLVKKNLNLDKLHQNLEYLCKQYPHVIIDLGMMMGFPTETEEEAMKTLDFLKSIRWVHFPYPFILNIHPGTEISKLAVESGISAEAISRSMNCSYHDIPETLPFSKSFAREYRAKFMSEYFLLKERLLQVLPYQLQVATKDELVRKYDNYLPMEIKDFPDILEFTGISKAELGDVEFLPGDYLDVPDLNKKMKQHFSTKEKHRNAIRVLLLDLSELYSTEKQEILHGEIPEPLGLMYLLTYLDKKFANQVSGKIAKSKVDFDSDEELRILINDFKPDVIGIRTLSYYKDFFHRRVLFIREWGVKAPIIVGGPYATMDYRLALRDPHVDVAVLGEGEVTFAELLEEVIKNNKKLPGEKILQDIQGIAYIPGKDKARLNTLSREIIAIDNISEKLAQQPVQNPGKINKINDLVYLLYTSGSTGTPKGVVLEHRSLSNLMRFTCQNPALDCGTILQFHTIGFDVSFHEIFGALLSGGRLYLIDSEARFDIPGLFDLIKKKQIKTLFLPPSFLKFIFSENDYAGIFPGGAAHIQAAGEQLVVNDKLRNYLRKNNTYLHNHYGPAETHVVTALTLDAREDIPALPSIGKPILNTYIYILNDEKCLQPIGVPGELYIGGIQVGRGYLNNPELNSERFINYKLQNTNYKQITNYNVQNYNEKAPGKKSYVCLEGTRGLAPLSPGKDHMQSCNHASMPSLHHPIPPLPHSPIYKTGDLARWLPDGNIQFLGRLDNQVKIRGFRVELEEIETHLLNHKEIRQAVVSVGIDKKGDRYICAYIVLHHGVEEFEEELKEYLAAKLPGYMVPSYIIPVGHIPLTRSGKIDRQALPEPGTKAGEDLTAPGNELEEKLVELWALVLGIREESIGTETDFFQLGGHSFKAIQLLSAIYREFGIKLSLPGVFKAPTIRKMAVVLSGAEETPVKDLESVEEREFYELSYNQKRLWLLHQVQPDRSSYNLAGRVELDHQVDGGIIKEVLYKLIERHESLRTGFRVVDDEIHQYVKKTREVALPLRTYSISFKEENQKQKYREDFYTWEQETPFDLGEFPLFRTLLLKLSETCYDLIFSMHHIITDGWSMEILTSEFLHFYQGLKAGKVDRLPPLRFQYKDFSAWHNKQLSDPVRISRSKQFWKSRLTAGIPTLDLPVDPMGDRSDVRGEAYQSILAKHDLEGLRQLAKDHKTSLFTVMFTLYLMLLSGLSNQEEVVCSVISSGREHISLHSLVGFFVNSILFKTRVDPGQGFSDFLDLVKAELVELFQHQDYPLELVFKELKIKYPELPVSFNMLNPAREEFNQKLLRGVQGGGFLEKSPPGRRRQNILDVKFDLEVYVREYEDSISLYWVYRKSLFHPLKIEYTANEYQQLVNYFKDNSHKSYKEYKNKNKRRVFKKTMEVRC